MTQVVQESLLAPYTHSPLEISAITPRSHDWTVVVHEFDTLGRFEAGAVATRALALYVDTASHHDPDYAWFTEARQILSTFKLDSLHGESTVLDERQQSVVKVAVESLAHMSPADLKRNPALAHYAGFVAAAKYYNGQKIEVGEEVKTSVPLAKDVPIYRPRRTVVPAFEHTVPAQDPTTQAEAQVAVIDKPISNDIVPPITQQERDTAWRLRLGPLTVSFALQRNSV